MKIEKEKLKRRIAVASGREPADLVIRNSVIVDVFNGGFLQGDAAIVDGWIAGIGTYEGHHVIDAQGRYLSPAFIDGHVHIESAMVPPPEFAKVLLPHGVTAVIADPHEIANVAGSEGIQFMLNASEHLPFDVYLMIPSCVPATSFEHAGAILTAQDIKPFFDHPRVLGLAEVMDYPAVINTSDVMIDKLVVALQHPGAKIDGHAAGLSVSELNAYAASWIRTDHECVSAEEALDRVSRGMYVMIREGTAAKNLKHLLKAVTERNARRFLFVTDDKHLDDLTAQGSVDHNVRLAIQQGLPPVTAIQMASLNVAECFGLAHKGAIAPGYQADFLLLDDLAKVDIFQVYKQGDLVAEKGQVVSGVLRMIQQQSAQMGHPSHLFQSVSVPNITADQLQIRLATNQAHVIGMIPDQLVTEHLIEEVNVQEGAFCPSVERDQLKLAVLERHHQTGNIGLGIVKGLGLQAGAIASTVAHDSHNVIVAGTNDQDMMVAVNEISKRQGGLVVVHDGLVVAALSLPLAGLMADCGSEQVLVDLENLHKALKQMGASPLIQPFLMLSFLALPVIPKLKLTDSGLFDVEQFAHIPVQA